MIGGCVPFGLAINNSFSVNEVLNEAITVNQNFTTAIIKVNSRNLILPVLKIHLTTNEIANNNNLYDNEYDAKFRFPLNLVVTNNFDKKLYEYSTILKWNHGSRSYDLNEVNSRQGKVIVAIDLDKFFIPPPGDIKVSVFLGEDTFYYAKILSANLIIYDNVYKHTRAIVTGMVIILAGIIVFIIGLVMLIFYQVKTSTNSPKISTETISQDTQDKPNKKSETDLNRSTINTYAMLCHLSAFAGFIFPFGGILGPLIMWQIKKDEHPFINRHGIAALNFHLSMFIYYFVGFLLVFIVIGFFVLMVLAVMDLVLTIVASIKASNGEEYRYPLAIPFIKIPLAE